MKSIDTLSGIFGGHPGKMPRLDDPKLNWRSIIECAADQCVLPALQTRVHELGAAPKLPVEIAEVLVTAEQLNRERNQAILGELEIVAALLNKREIEPLLLKGAAYCVTGIYRNQAARFLQDLDLLIPKQQLSSAVQILLENGFEQDDTDRFCRFRHHHPALRRTGSVQVELHHSLGMGGCKSLLPAAEVLAHSVPYLLAGARVRIPSPDHLMTHLIMHSQMHHPYYSRIWPSLRAMYDLLLIDRHFGKQIQWTAIERRFREAGQEGLLAMHLLQIREVLGESTLPPIRLSGLTRLSWMRRKVLRLYPPLRYIDPVYMYSTMFGTRLHLLQNVLAVSGGWKEVANGLFAVSKRFFDNTRSAAASDD